MAKRIVLTRLELEWILGVAGNSDEHATIDDDHEMTDREKAKALAAYESGMEKLRTLLARAEGRKRRSRTTS